MSTLPVVWVMMGLRFLGAGPSKEGKWLPYQIPYETKEACLAAKADALNSKNIHRSYLDCIPFLSASSWALRSWSRVLTRA